MTAQCQQGLSNVSAVSERQCAQTCMHITCFNVVAQKTLFTDSVQLTGLLHDPLI